MKSRKDQKAAAEYYEAERREAECCARSDCGYPRSFHGPGYSTQAGCCESFIDPAPQPPADATSPNDKCAGTCVDGGLCGYVRRAHGMELGQIGHRFVEPKPAGPPVTGDGDAAVVREIANRWTKEWSGSEGRTRMPGPDAIANAVREAIARGRALGARDASFNNDWFCSTECMGYTRDDIDKGFCVYCAAPVARDGERKP